MIPPASPSSGAAAGGDPLRFEKRPLDDWLAREAALKRRTFRRT